MGKMRHRARALLGIAELHDRLDRQRELLGEQQRELARVAPQVAALEQRMEALRQLVEGARPAAGGPADPPAEADVQALWVDIQRQHEQVRARITAAARFEERLRVLEERVGQAPDRDDGRPGPVS